MIYKLKNQIMDYAWGTYDFIPELLAQKPTGKPQAELWMGVHPKAPSMIGGRPLNVFIQEHGYPELKFLFKVLSAREALSIQVHPNKQQAEEGFRRESSLALDDPKRNYRDSNHKPEQVYALTEFYFLSGFRPLDEIRKHFPGLKFQDHKSFYLQVVSADPSNVKLNVGNDIRQWISELDNLYPQDPGTLAPAYLNLCRLSPGESIFVTAGILHSYLKGTILEIMPNSDNVIRGGLTPKHMYVDELMNVVDFREQAVDLVDPENGEFETVYPTPAEEFNLSRVVNGFKGESVNGEVLLAISGSGRINDLEFYKGDCMYVPPGEKYLIDAAAELYRVTQ